MNQNLEGKVAIITGSSRGIGRSVAERLAEQGAAVIINYSSSPKQAEAVVQGIQGKAERQPPFRPTSANPRRLSSCSRIPRSCSAGLISWSTTPEL